MSIALSLAQLLAVYPLAGEPRCEAHIEAINNVLDRAQVTTHLRLAMLLAQCGAESGQLRWLVESAESAAVYEGRKDLGNFSPGDGVKYRGRGVIQITGRFNYDKAGHALAIDLLNHPELAAEPSTAWRICAWYWTTRGLNTYADSGDILGATRRINGGLNGLEERTAIYERAIQVLAGSHT
jgi:putative chitinase